MIFVAALLAPLALAPALVPSPPYFAGGDAPSLDTPLGRLMQDSDTRAILERDLPNLDAHPRLRGLQTLSLRIMVPNSRGWFTQEQLQRVDADFSALRDRRRYGGR